MILYSIKYAICFVDILVINDFIYAICFVGSVLLHLSVGRNMYVELQVLFWTVMCLGKKKIFKKKKTPIAAFWAPIAAFLHSM